ncbi:uncharacterized protein LOC144912288 isoform X3 [Branchiostoma floridae x Branchiostoma belcheri]
MANVKVAIRVRPLSKRELDARAQFIIQINENTTSVTNIKLDGTQEGYGDTRDRLKHFVFDYSYWSVDQNSPDYAAQEQIFQDLGTDVLASAFEGYNACVFAYGQTGTGKTYTMMGDTDRLGLIPRISEGLFSRIDDHVGERVTFKTEVSYLEIYNERVRDLLCHPGAKANTYSLKVREHPEKGPYVQDLSRHLVSDYTSLERLIQRGNENRTTAATYIHDLSSRSHAIFTIYFSQAKLEDNLPREIVSKIHLVDLAGSERADPNYHKDRLKEGANINRSLVTLGTVISALAYQQEKGATSSPWTSENSLLSASTESFGSIGDDLGSSLGKAGKKMAFIPYRDSVLTWLLKDSLGGNAKTIMIAAISPASICYSETINTLRYARRAKRIVNRPKINEDPNVRLIRELRAEIGRLKKLLQNHDMARLYLMNGHNSYNKRSSTMSLNEDRNQVITEMLMRNEEKVEQLTRDWSDKWDETQTIIQDSRLGLRRPCRSPAAVIVDSELPHLIGMADTLLSTGIVIYRLKDGKTIIGTEENEDEPDIVLDGPFMEKEHCVIRNENNTVFLHPVNNAVCAVNGMDITTPIRLKQGAVILLGKMHMFRFNNPFEAARLRRERSTGSMNGVGLGSTMSLNSDGEGDSPPPLIPSPISPKSVLSLSWEWERYQKVEAEKVEEARRQLEELQQQRVLAEEEHQRLQTEMAEKQKAHQEAIERQRALLERLRQEADGAQSVAEQEIQEARRRLAQEIQEAEDLKLKQQQLERQEFAVQTDSMESRETGIQYDVMGQPRDRAKPTTQSVSTTATTLTDQVLIDETRLKELQEKERLFEQLRWRMDHDTMALEMDRVSPIGAQDENVYVSPKASTDDDSSSVATTVKAHPKLGLLKMEEMSEGQTPSTLTPATMTPLCHSPRSGSPTPSNYSTSSMSLPSMSDSSMSMSMEHSGQKSKAALTRRRSREGSSPTKEKPSPTAEEVTARLYPGSPSSVRKAWQANSKGEKEEEGSVPVPERSKSPTTYKKNGRTYVRKRALHDASDDNPFSAGQLPPVKPKTRPAPSSSSVSEDHGSPANGTRSTSPKKERQRQLQPKSPTRERSSVSTLQSDSSTTQTKAKEQKQSVVTGTTVHREKRIVVKKAQAETDSVSLLLQEAGDSSKPLTKPDKKHRPRVFHVEDSVGKILHDSGDQTDSGISVSIETMTTRVEVKADQTQTFPLDRRKVESEDTQTPSSFLEQVSARLEAVQQTKGAFDSQSKADSSSFGSFVGKDRGDMLNRRAVSASRASSVAETLSEDWSTVSDSAAMANIKKRWPRRRFIDRPEDVSPITWGPTPYQRPRSAGDERKPRWWSVGGMGGGGGGSDTPLSLSTSDTDSLYSVRSARRYGSADSIAHDAFARSLRGEEGASPSPAPIRRSKSAGAVKTTSSGVSMSALADIRSRSPSSRLLPTPPKRKPPVGGSRTTSPRSPAGAKSATKPKLDISKSATSQEKRVLSPTKPQKSLGAKPKRETSPTKSVERKVSSTKAAKDETSPTEAAKSPTKTVKRVGSPPKTGSGTKSPTKTTSPTKPLPPTKPTKAVSLLATKSKSQMPKPPITRPKPKLDDLKKKVKSTPRSEPDGKAREDKKVKPPVPKKPTSLSRDSKASVGKTDTAPKVTSPVKRKTPSPAARSPSVTSPTRSSPRSFPSDASTRSDPSVKSKSPSEASSKSDSKGRKSKSPVQKGSTGKPRKITSYVIGPEPNVEKYRPKSKVRAHIKKTLAERAKRGDTPSSQEGSILSGGTSSVSIAMDDVMTEATEESVYSDDSLEGEEGAERPSVPKAPTVHPLPIKERIEASSDNESIYSVDSLMAEGETSPESDSLMVKKVGRKKVSKDPSEVEADSLDSADSLEDAWEDGAVAALKKAVEAGDGQAAQRGVNVHIEATAEMQSSMETVSTAVSSDVTSQTTEGGDDASSVIELGEEMMVDADVTSASAAGLEEEKSSVDVPTQEDRVTTEEVTRPAATSPTSLNLKEVPQKPAEDGESPSEKDSLASDSSPDKEARAGVTAVKPSSGDAAGDGDDEAARYSADSLNEADSPTEAKPGKSEKAAVNGKEVAIVDEQGRLTKEDQQQYTPSSATRESVDKDVTQEQDTPAPVSKTVDSDNDSMHSDDSLADTKEGSSLPAGKQQPSRPARKVRYTRKLPSETDTFSDDSLSDRAHRSSPPKIHRRVKQLQDSTESDGVYSVDSLSEDEPKSPRKTPAARRVSSEVGEASMPAAEPIAEEDKEESSRADDQVSEDSLGEEEGAEDKDDDKQQGSEVLEEDSVTTVDEKQSQPAEIDQDIPVVPQEGTEQETKQVDSKKPEPTSGERPDLDKDWQELKTAKTEREETKETEMITREDELADHRYLLAEANRSSDHEVDSDASNEEKQERLDSANDDRSPEAPAMNLKDNFAEESQTKHHDDELSEPDGHISEEPVREVEEQTSTDVRDNHLAVESTVLSDKEQSDGSDFDLPSVLHIISDIQAQAVEVSNLLTTEEQKVLPSTVESGQQTTIRPTNKTLTTGPVVVDEVGFEEVQSESADVRTHTDKATTEMHTQSATSAVGTSSAQFLPNGERLTEDAESGRHSTDRPDIDSQGKVVCTTGTQWDKPEQSTTAVGTETTGQQDLGINTEDSTDYSDSTTNTEEDVHKGTDTSTGTQSDMPEKAATTFGTESIGEENFGINIEDSTQLSDSGTHKEVASKYTDETTGRQLDTSERLSAVVDTESTRQQNLSTDFTTDTGDITQLSDSTTTTEQSVSEYSDPASRSKSEQGASAEATVTTAQQNLVTSTDDPIHYSDSIDSHPGASVDTPLDKPDQRATAVSSESAEEQDISQYTDSVANTEQHTVQHTQVTNTDDMDMAGSHDEQLVGDSELTRSREFAAGDPTVKSPVQGGSTSSTRPPVQDSKPHLFLSSTSSNTEQQKVVSPGDLTPHLEKHFPTSHLVKERAAASRKVRDNAQKDIVPPQPLSPAIEFFAEEFAIRTVDGAMSWISQEIQEGTTIDELKSQYESNRLGRPGDSFPTPETTSEEEDAADSSEKVQVIPSQQISTPAELVFRKIVVEGSDVEEDSLQTESPEDDFSEEADKAIPRIVETTRVSSVAGCITYHIEHEIDGEESEHQVEEDTEDDDSGKDVTQNDIGSASLAKKDIFVFESQQVENFAERVISKAVTEAVTSVLTTDSESDLSDFEKSPAYSRKNISSAKGQEAAKATPARLADDSQKESLQLLSSDTSTYSSTASLEDSSDHTLIYQKSFQLLSSDTSTYGSTVSLEDTVEDISDKTLVSSPEVEMLADSVVSVAIKEAFRDASKAEPVGELPERTEPDGEHQPYAGPNFAVASTGPQQQPHKTSCVDEDSDTGMTDDELDNDNDSTSLLTPPPMQEPSDVHQVNVEEEAQARRDVMSPEIASVPSTSAEDATDIDSTKELPDAEPTPIVVHDSSLQEHEHPVSEVSEMTSEGASVVADLPELKQDQEEVLPENVEASIGPEHEDTTQDDSSISSHEGTSEDKAEGIVQQVGLEDDEAPVPIADISPDSENQNLYPEVVKIIYSSEDDKEPVEQGTLDGRHVENNNDIVPADAVIHALDHMEALVTDKSDHEETSEEPDTVTWVDSIEEDDLPEDEVRTVSAPSPADADDSHPKAGVCEQSNQDKKSPEKEDVLEWQPFVSAATAGDILETSDLPPPVDSSTPNGHKVPTGTVDKVLAEDEKVQPILPMSTDREPVPQEQTDDDKYMSAASSGEDIDRWTKVSGYKAEGLSDESEVQTSQPDSEDDKGTTSTEDTGEGLAYQGFTSPEAMSTGTTPTPTSPFFQEPGTSDQGQPSLFEQHTDIDTLETYKTQLPEDEQASSNETEEDDSASSFSASSTDSEEYSEHDALVERSMMVSRSQSEQILPASKRPRTSDWGRQQSLESAGISAAEPIGERSRSLPRNVAMDNDDMDEDTPKQKVGTEQPLDVVCAPCPVQHGSVSFEEAELRQSKITHQPSAPEKTQREESGLFVSQDSLLHDDAIDKNTTLMHAGHEAGIECAVSSSVIRGDLPSSVSVSDFELPSCEVPSHPELALPGSPTTSLSVDRESMVSDASFPPSTPPEQTPPGVSPVLLQNTTKLAEHKAPVSASNHQLSDSLSLCGPRQVDEARSSTDAKLNDTANMEQASPLMDLPTLQPQDHSTHLYQEQKTGKTTDDLLQSDTTEQTETANLPTSVAYMPNMLPNSELYTANSAQDENIVKSNDAGGTAPSTESSVMISPYDYQGTLPDLPTNSYSYQQAEMYQQMTGHVRTSSFEEELVGSYPSLPVKTRQFVGPAATALPSGVQGASDIQTEVEKTSDRRKITLPMYYSLDSQESDTLPSVESDDGNRERETGQWQEHLSDTRQTVVSLTHQPTDHDHQLLEQTDNNYVVDVESPNNPQLHVSSPTLEPGLISHPHPTQQTVQRCEATSATAQPQMESLHIEVSSVASSIHAASEQAVSSHNNTAWGTSVGDEYLLKTELADGVQFQQMRQNTTDMSPSPLNVFDLDPNDNDLRVLRETQESLDRVLAETGSLSPVSSTDEVRSSDSELMALMAELEEEEYLENVGKSTSFSALLDQPLSPNSSDEDWPHSVSLPSVRERERSPVRPLIVVSKPSEVDPLQMPSLHNNALPQNTTVSVLDNQPRVSANFSTFEPTENTVEPPNLIPHDNDSEDVFALPSDHIMDSPAQDPQTQDTVVLRRKPKDSKESKAETAAKRVSFSDEVDILQLSSQSLASETNEPVFTSPVVTTTAVKKLDSPVSTIELKSILKPDSSPQGKLLPGAEGGDYLDAAAKERITFYPSDTSGFKTPIDSPKLKRSNPRKPGSTCSEGNLDNLDSILTSYTAATGGKSSSMDNDINALTRPLTTPLQAYAIRVKKAKGESSSSEDSEVEYVVDTDPDLEQESPEDIEPNDLIRETDSLSQTLDLENSNSQMYKEASTTASHRHQHRSPQQSEYNNPHSIQSPNQHDYTRTQQDAVTDQLTRGQYSTSSPAPTSEIIYDLDKPVFQPDSPSSLGGVTETVSQQVSSDMEGSMYTRRTTTNLQTESALNLRNTAVCQETQLRQQQMNEDNRDAVSPGLSAEYRDTDNLSQLLQDTSDLSNNSGQSSDSTNTAELFQAAEDLVSGFEDTETFPGTNPSLSPRQGTVDRGSLHLNLESSSQSSSNASVSTLVERRVLAQSQSSETVSIDTRYDTARGMDRETVGLASQVKITKDMQTGDDDNLQPLRVITPSKFQKTVSTADEDQVHRSSGKSVSLPSLGPSPPLRAWDIFKQRYEQKRNTREKAIGTDDREMRSEAVGTDDRELLLRHAATGMDDLPDRPTSSHITEADWSLEYEHLSGISLGTTFSTEHSTEYPEEEGPGEYHVTTEPEYAENGLSEVTSGYGSELNLHAADAIRRHREASQKDMTRQKCSEYIQRQEGYSDESSSNEESEDASLNSPTRQPAGLLIEASDLDTSPSVSPMFLSPDGERGKKHVSWSPEPQVIISQQSGGSQSTDSLLDENPLCPTSPEISYSSRSDSRTEYTASANNVRSSTPARNSVQPALSGSPQFRDAGMSVHLSSLLEKSAHSDSFTQTDSFSSQSLNLSLSSSSSSTDFYTKENQLQNLKHERDSIMAYFGRDLSRQELTVELAEAKINYGIGETDAMLRMLQFGLPLDHPLAEVYMKEKEKKAFERVRSRSASPVRNISPARTPSGSGSVSPEKYSSPTAHLRTSLSPQEASTLSPQKHNQIDELLMEYQRARHHADMEINKARQKLRERTESERRRLQQEMEHLRTVEKEKLSAVKNVERAVVEEKKSLLKWEKPVRTPGETEGGKTRQMPWQLDEPPTHDSPQSPILDQHIDAEIQQLRQQYTALSSIKTDPTPHPEPARPQPPAPRPVQRPLAPRPVQRQHSDTSSVSSTTSSVSRCVDEHYTKTEEILTSAAAQLQRIRERARRAVLMGQPASDESLQGVRGRSPTARVTPSSLHNTTQATPSPSSLHPNVTTQAAAPHRRGKTTPKDFQFSQSLQKIEQAYPRYSPPTDPAASRAGRAVYPSDLDSMSDISSAPYLSDDTLSIASTEHSLAWDNYGNTADSIVTRDQPQYHTAEDFYAKFRRKDTTHTATHSELTSSRVQETSARFSQQNKDLPRAGLMDPEHPTRETQAGGLREETPSRTRDYVAGLERRREDIPVELERYTPPKRVSVETWDEMDRHYQERVERQRNNLLKGTTRPTPQDSPDTTASPSQEPRSAQPEDLTSLGPRLTSHVLSEVSQVLGGAGGFSRPRAAGGWIFQSEEKDVVIYRKILDNSPIHCFLGVGLVAAPVGIVWGVVRDLNTRRHYDRTLKDIRTVATLGRGARIVHSVHETSQCFLQQPRDFCCLLQESNQGGQHVLAAQSVSHPSCPLTAGVTRGHLSQCGLVLEPVVQGNKEVTRVAYLIQVDLGSSVLPQLVNLASRKQPHLITYLSNYICPHT